MTCLQVVAVPYLISLLPGGQANHPPRDGEGGLRTLRSFATAHPRVKNRRAAVCERNWCSLTWFASNKPILLLLWS
ncbi:hypothetical protein VTI28DRAFT_5936 [Corynascus sepedonium]